MIYVALALYRSGYSGLEMPWADNQLWAEATGYIPAEATSRIQLMPRYGAAADLYQVTLAPAESPIDGWLNWRVQLDHNTMRLGPDEGLPLSWYNGAPSDWPTGLARFPEIVPPRVPMPGRGHVDGPPGVWTLAARRAG